MSRLILFLCLLHTFEVTGSEVGKCASDDKGSCSEDKDQSTLLQTRVNVNGEGTAGDIDNDEALSEEEAEEAVRSKLGSLSRLATRLSNGACEASGLWTDADGMTEIGFVSNKSSLQFDFAGQPRVTLMYDADAKLSSMSIGDVQAIDAEESEATNMRKALIELAKVADSSLMKRFSSTLGHNQLVGAKGQCLMQLHMLAASLAKLKQQPGDLEEPMEEAEEEDPMANVEEEEEGALAEMTDSAEFFGRRRRRSRRRRRTGWSGYGFGPDDPQGCPATMTPDWQCRTTSSLTARRRSPPGPWYTGGASQLGGYHSNSNVDLKCTGGGGCSNSDVANGNCASGRTVGECVGLCGASCDCWESICGSSYKCGYNPSCCAHDKTCGRRRIGNYWKCIAAGPVYQACQ